MPEDEIKNIIRDFIQALIDGDSDKILYHVTDNIIWSSPDSTVKSKAGFKRYIGWMKQANPEVGIKESGLGHVRGFWCMSWHLRIDCALFLWRQDRPWRELEHMAKSVCAKNVGDPLTRVARVKCSVADAKKG